MIEDLGHGVHCIDTGYLRPGLAASFLVRDGDETAIIETGTPRTVGRILKAMSLAGVAPASGRLEVASSMSGPALASGANAVASTAAARRSALC